MGNGNSNSKSRGRSNGGIGRRSDDEALDEALDAIEEVDGSDPLRLGTDAEGISTPDIVVGIVCDPLVPIVNFDSGSACTSNDRPSGLLPATETGADCVCIAIDNPDFTPIGLGAIGKNP